MTQPRSRLVSLETTPYYHCIARCVRRSFLCGEDTYTGKDFSHRRGWILDRIKLLSTVFTMDICAYAIMSNHYHLVLRVNKKRSEQLTDSEVIERWCKLFKGPVLVQRYRNREEMTQAERDAVSAIVSVWRQRLSDLSWFMKCLNENIARMANEEDGCKGRFWESRFKSQALLDEVALIACMSYVDLNPIRAGIADDLQGSEFTSIQERIEQFAHKTNEDRKLSEEASKELVPFQAPGIMEINSAEEPQESIPFPFKEYLQLVEWMGGAQRQDKLGFIASSVPPILITMGLDPEIWLDQVSSLGRRYFHVVGSPQRIEALSETVDFAWFKGIRQSVKLYGKTG